MRNTSGPAGFQLTPDQDPDPAPWMSIANFSLSIVGLVNYSPLEQARVGLEVRASMPCCVEDDGTARPLDGEVIADVMHQGGRVFPTIAGAVAFGGVSATAFDRPASLQEVMPGQEWLEKGVFTPHSRRLVLRISAENGKLVVPSRLHHSTDVALIENEDQLARFDLIAAWAGLGTGRPLDAITALHRAILRSPTAPVISEVSRMAEGLPEEARANLLERIEALPASEDASPAGMGG